MIVWNSSNQNGRRKKYVKETYEDMNNSGEIYILIKIDDGSTNALCKNCLTLTKAGTILSETQIKMNNKCRKFQNTEL